MQERLDTSALGGDYHPAAERVISKTPHEIKVKTSLASGFEVMHRFAVVADEVLFEATFTNLTDKPVDIEWMQPCIRVGDFTGLGQDEYPRRCFIFTDKGLTRLNETNRTEEAIYRGGQVYVPACIDRNDVNPRPLSPDVPANKLIGCFSADEKSLLATAWTDVQELFQGVIVCIHADPRIGGLGPAQRKKSGASSISSRTTSTNFCGDIAETSRPNPEIDFSSADFPGKSAN